MLSAVRRLQLTTLRWALLAVSVKRLSLSVFTELTGAELGSLSTAGRSARRAGGTGGGGVPSVRLPLRVFITDA